MRGGEGASGASGRKLHPHNIATSTYTGAKSPLRITMLLYTHEQHTCTHTHTHAHIHARMRAHKHANRHTCMHTHTHKHTHEGRHTQTLTAVAFFKDLVHLVSKPCLQHVVGLIQHNMSGQDTRSKDKQSLAHICQHICHASFTHTSHPITDKKDTHHTPLSRCIYQDIHKGLHEEYIPVTNKAMNLSTN